MKVCNSCRKKIRSLERDLLAPEKRPRVRQNPTRWFTGLEGYGAPDGLLTTTSAKTVLGEALGYLSGVLYMLPVQRLEEIMQLTSRGRSRCAAASAGCAGGCLIVSGQGGGVNSNVLKRARKTWLYEYDRKWFMAALERSIQKVVDEAARTTEVTVDGQRVPFIDPITNEPRSFIPCIRLNGTTDILWEKPQAGVKIMDLFPDVQFYDYTKWPLPKRGDIPPNYDLTFSYSDNKGSAKQAWQYIQAGMNVAVVWRTLDGVVDVIEKGSWKAKGWPRRVPVINGDRDDLRFLDPHPCIVALFAKVSMLPEVAEEQRQDPFGFFMERLPEAAAAEGWYPPPPNAVDPDSPASKAVWKARCRRYEKVCVPDPRDPLGTRKIKIDICAESDLPAGGPLHATQIAKRKKAWTKAYYGGDATRALTEEGVSKHLALAQGGGWGYRLPLEEAYAYGAEDIEAQRRQSRLTATDEILRRLSHNSAPTKRWMSEHTPEQYTKLLAVEKRIRSKTAKNVARRTKDKRLREDLLVEGYMAQHGIVPTGPEWFQPAAGRLAGSLLARGIKPRSNPAAIHWRDAAKRVFAEKANAASDRGAMPRNPMELAYWEAVYDVWSTSARYGLAGKMLKKATSLKDMRQILNGALEAADEQLQIAEDEGEPELISAKQGIVDALEEMDETLVQLSRHAYVRTR
jgi:hypothetical protein